VAVLPDYSGGSAPAGRACDTQAAIDAGIAAHTPHEIKPGQRYALVVPAGGNVKEIDNDLDKYLDAPRRKRGTTLVRDALSFCEFYEKHADDGGTEIYADIDALAITAVLNADQGTGEAPGWRDHRVVLQLKHSQPWIDWAERNGKIQSQTEFANFIEDHLADIREPAAAEMLEIVQTFNATTKVNFGSSTILANGQRQLTYLEETQTSAGAKKNLTIPGTITLGLEVFDGATVVDKLTARFRTAVREGNLLMSYHLDRPEDVLKKAFKAIAGSIAEATGNPVWLGTPAG